MKKILDFNTHLTIAMLLGMLTIIILDDRNPMMEFLTSNASRIYFILMCISGLITAIRLAVRTYRECSGSAAGGRMQ